CECKTLDTKPKVFSDCGKNVTLTCNASTSVVQDSKLMKFEWQFKNTTVCQYEQKNFTGKIQCESANTTSGLSLTLTIRNITPTDEGVYHCKLHLSREAANGQSHIKVEDCLGSTHKSLDNGTASCTFDSVYPSGVVHWYQGDSNITNASKTHEKQDKDGFYRVKSEVPVKIENHSQTYNCSLWMPSTNRYIFSQLVSLGSKGQLQWICIIMGILMRSFII
ncbi:hypothetical protein ILYODFUR_026832, partial [Ilyodon furcidens]